jgi:hypothetical protein
VKSNPGSSGLIFEDEEDEVERDGVGGPDWNRAATGIVAPVGPDIVS